MNFSKILRTLKLKEGVQYHGKALTYYSEIFLFVFFRPQFAGFEIEFLFGDITGFVII